MKTIPIRHIAAPEKEQSMVGRFSIRNVKQLLNGKDLVHNLHKHDFYFVLAVEEGMGIHEIDFIEYQVHNYCVFILRPGQVHRLELRACTTGFLMEFDLSFYQPKNTITDQRWKRASSKNYCEVEAANFIELHSILSNLFKELVARQDGYIEAIKANLDLFFIEYVRQGRNLVSLENVGGSSYTQERFEELLGLLEARVTTMKSVSQYAELLCLSSYQLNGITKASVGKTVSQLIDEQLILEAKRLLLATPNQIKDIADKLGYEDVSYFIRFFKKHTGHSPDAFRKNFN